MIVISEKNNSTTHTHPTKNMLHFKTFFFKSRTQTTQRNHFPFQFHGLLFNSLFCNMRSSSEDQPILANHLHTLKFLDLFLRLCVVPLSAVSIWLTVTDKQENSTYGKLEFKNFKGLKYMVCINAICAGYALVAVVLSWLRCLLTKAWVFFVSDQVVAYLLLTSGSAVVEILYLAYNGDRTVSWSEACSSYGTFCNRVKVALILQVFALFCFCALSMISAYRTFSKFEPPVSSKGAEEEQRN